MKSLLALLFVSFLIGCAPTVFFNNGPADAFSVGQSISMKRIDSERSAFQIYKINGEHYALLPAFNQSSGSISNINDAIIFSPKDIEGLRGTCKKILEAYDGNPGKEIQIVEYHLVLNKPEVAGISSTVAYHAFANAFASTRTQAFEFNRVIFRLQFLNEGGTLLRSGKSIDYMFKDSWKKISVDELRILLSDLQK